MACVRQSGTGPELLLRSELLAQGAQLLEAGTATAVGGGRPDFALEGPIAVFVDGCFWHGCPWHYSAPGTREGFWAQKLRGNVDRDRAHSSALRSAGWMVLRYWEHEVAQGAAGIARAILSAGSGSEDVRGESWRVVRVERDPETGMETRVLEQFWDPEVSIRWVGPRRTAGSPLTPMNFRAQPG